MTITTLHPLDAFFLCTIGIAQDIPFPSYQPRDTLSESLHSFPPRHCRILFRSNHVRRKRIRRQRANADVLSTIQTSRVILRLAGDRSSQTTRRISERMIPEGGKAERATPTAMYSFATNPQASSWLNSRAISRSFATIRTPEVPLGSEMNMTCTRSRR